MGKKRKHSKESLKVTPVDAVTGANQGQGDVPTTSPDVDQYTSSSGFKRRYVKNGTDDVAQSGEDESLLRNLLLFVDNTRCARKDQNEVLLKESLAFLDNRLRQEHQDHVMQRHVDIAQLVLPWLLKQLLYYQQQQVQDDPNHKTSGKVLFDRAHWQLTESSIAVLIQNQSKEILSTILPQGILNKVVPPLVLMAIDGEENSTTNNLIASNTPANIYKMLVQIPKALSNGMTQAEPLFRPTLQLALQDVLKPMVDKGLSRVKPSETGKLLFPITLEWILDSVLSRGNPKACFQLLATKQMLVTFSRLFSYLKAQGQSIEDDVSILRRLLSRGILSCEHHLVELLPLLKEEKKDRPRSKKKAPYQQKFVDIFQDSVSSKDAMNQEALLDLLSVLLDQFIREMSELRKHTGASTHPHAAFHMFRLLTQFALARKNVFPGRVWTSVKDMTRLMITHNIYIPSQDDGKQSQFLCLNEISSTLMAFFSKGDLPSSDFLVEMIATMQNLLELNHGLLHENLASVIVVSCMEQNKEDYSLLAARNQFWLKTVETYRKLRQQSYLVESMLKAISQSPKISFNILDQPDVASAFAVSMESSPIAEVQTIFSLLEKAFNDSTACNESLQKATVLAVLLFRTICVTNESNASAISALVQDFSQQVIAVLIESNYICALKLCAWLIHLQGQCVFWLGREHQLRVPEEVQTKLSDDFFASDSVLDEALLLLVSHRLEQLVSMMHDHEIAALHHEGEVLDNDSTLSRLRDEGNRLAAVMSRCADSQVSAIGQSTRSGWLYIAQCVHVWAIFADQKAADEFLSKVLSALAPSNEASSIISAEERNVALTLMGDVSFLDIFADRIQIVSHSQLASILLERHDDSATKSLHFSQRASEALIALRVCKPWKIDIKDFQETIEEGRSESYAYSGSPEKLSSVHTILQYVNSLPNTVMSSETYVIQFKTSLFLERCCAIAAKLTGEAGPMLGILMSVRIGLSGALLSQDIVDFLRKHPASAMSILNYVCDSTRDILESQEISDQIAEDLLSSTCELLSGLTGIVLASSPLEVSGKALKQMIAKSTETVSRSSLYSLMSCRAVLRGTEKARLQSSQKEKEEAHQILEQKMWNISWQAYQHRLGSSSSNSLSELEISLSFLLLGDLLTLASRLGLDEEGEVIDEAEKVLEGQSNEVEGAIATKRAQTYCIACLVKVRPTSYLSQLILSELSSSDNKSYNALLESSFCQLMENAGEGYARDLLESMLENDAQNDDAAASVALQFKLMTILLDSAQSSRTVECLLLHGKDILMAANRQLFSRRQGNDNLIVVASNKMLRALIRRKDILVMGDQDLHHILTGINRVVGGSISLDEGNGASQILDCDCFIECCKTLLLLLQRCVKQLYPAVHLVISLMYSMMESILQITEGQAELLCLEKRCNEFTRLCEMLSPHKDVYKKHVVGLVLFFVKHLVKEKDLSLTVKNAMLPAVHCLLDTFSEYETSQLNALMSTPAKSTFRSIYQSYRKFHAYKGG